MQRTQLRLRAVTTADRREEDECPFKMTQSEAGRILGISTQRVSDVERRALCKFTTRLAEVLERDFGPNAESLFDPTHPEAVARSQTPRRREAACA